MVIVLAFKIAAGCSGTNRTSCPSTRTCQLAKQSKARQSDVHSLHHMHSILGARILHGKVELIWVALLSLALEVLQDTTIMNQDQISISSADGAELK